MDKSEKAFEIIAKYSSNNRDLINFGIIIGLLAIAFVASSHQIPTLKSGEKITYINASSINAIGLGINSSNNTQLISEFNDGYWQGNETTSSFQIYINFLNVTKFNFVESVHKYNSSIGTSSHEIGRYIWCTTSNDWVELEEFSNENEWYYHTKSIVDSKHFILPNGTVMLKYDHTENGNTNHDIFIDVCRLVKIS